ncbi:anaerobic ribonucleoside-triphosphate reductase activating protein [Desulfovibrio sp. OttesenSCG-928-A18]|nr:anaerobic ribonucleoside-triphosphate reductase activating protein [Desulfovibrio sp. OttesenSCG-928-A18]
MSTSGMALAGLHKLTAIDYPGLVAATVFTQGCNFRCPYCHNRQLTKRRSGETLLAGKDVFAFLKKRASQLDGLVVSGGEPTLQPGLADFCREVKKLGYRIKLDTNGSRPQVLVALMDEELVDYVAMDCKSAPGAYADFFCPEPDIQEKVETSARLLREGRLAHEFRTTCVSPYVAPAMLRDMAAVVGPDSPWLLQAARLDAVPPLADLQALTPGDMRELAAQAEQYGAQPVLRMDDHTRG